MSLQSIQPKNSQTLTQKILLFLSSELRRSCDAVDSGHHQNHHHHYHHHCHHHHRHHRHHRHRHHHHHLRHSHQHCHRHHLVMRSIVRRRQSK